MKRLQDCKKYRNFVRCCKVVFKSFHTMESGKGYVYILTNPSFREDWVKIGKSSRPVDVRSKELDNTAVPLPFEIYATLYTSKYDKVEKQNNSGAYQGPKYFSYNGKVLSELRKEIEKE